MVTSQRAAVPDGVRTNGATPNPWWSNAVVYQIYPRSFQDTNGDGYGDINGIISRLDYLAGLGVDVLWLSPVYKSPQNDNGYDISDYQDIDPMFGSLDDMDRLIAQAHRRGLKIVMDLVVNHTSDEHAWFQASRNRADEHADWYWWRPAKPGFAPGAPGAEPNQWGSYFGGSAWQFDPQRGEYYFHQFSPKQPDLNWENPQVRHAVYAMMNWWMDRGIDGFRMDVIVLISKFLDPAGKLPGEAGSQLADGPVLAEGYSNPQPFCCDGPHLDEYLAEMRHAVFEGREGYLTVGEAPGVTAQRNAFITDPANKELDMVFLFDHVGIDQNGSKWNIEPFEPAKLRAVMTGQQDAVRDKGWASLYFNNHDQPRVVSRWGDDSTEELRSRSAKALGLVLHMHRGTPYVYEGEELGMTNAGFTELSQYRDLESINFYHELVEDAKLMTPQAMLHAIAVMGRDNARTPMQWDDSRYAGFTAPDAPTEPWLAVNANHASINAAAEVRDPDSVYNFYKRLIALRHTQPVISAGRWDVIDADDPSVYAFTRTVEGEGGEQVLVVANLTSQSANIPTHSASLLAAGFAVEQMLIGTVSRSIIADSVRNGVLVPWEAFVYRLH
ncbi:glycoside hydrolase family 13 protein [Bifidobacterium sp.]|jgi:oligo-1,6-glucosidase|uniref:glycoside hydrolase family 13 protein n=1 Tax=Bifidobacterium sp. TaxID=41200 RepID=UPI0025C18E81|nr:alpha-glucosidase [Bifidobacterium sp.]MCH4209548.1 alpha-glucosidase [Bifidobacterium sp.]MCI1225565.1 alpha-glucosidase [Bifidobacterium sp.]